MSSTEAWRQFRAFFVLFHILAITLAASPSPAAGMNRKAWAEPTVQREFKDWAQRFGLEAKVFENGLWDLAVGFLSVRKGVMSPFNPYIEATGADQNWQMFVAPHTTPTRMYIDVHTPGTWTVVFRERDPEARWNAEAFELERLRAAIFRWGWPNYAEAWTKACKAFSGRLFAERADIDAVRCKMERVRSPSPAEVQAGTIDPGKFVYIRTELR